MGSVSSLIPGHNLHNKHCRASEHKPKKSRRGARGLEGLLKHGLQHQTGTSNNAKPGHNEDFFYIKVSHDRPRSNAVEEEEGEEMEPRRRRGEGGGEGTPPKLLPLSGKLEKSAEKSVIRPTSFVPVLPRSSSSSMETHNHLSTILGVTLSPNELHSEQIDPKQDASSGTLSDSGRNSMSSLPTHSTGTGSSGGHKDNLSTCRERQHHHPMPRPGTSTPNANGSNWNDSSDSGGITSSTTGSPDRPDLFSQQRRIPGSDPDPDLNPSSGSPVSGGGIRSPITTDETLIEQLERRLLEQETELAELQSCLGEKETDTSQLFQEKQSYCEEEMTGLKQRCSTKLRQVSQRARHAQQQLQLQVLQLQQEQERLQEELQQLSRDKEAAENRLRNFQKQQKQLGPALEETQWEVCQKAGEISLLKQQLRDLQADVVSKLSEIVALKSSMREKSSRLDELEKKNKGLEQELRSQTTELEVCQNELHRKKNEAELLREKVCKLETDVKGMKQELELAKKEQLQEQEQQQRSNLRAGQTETDSSETDFLHRELERMRVRLKDERKLKDKMMSDFQQERHTWNSEKSRVIRYQKQLQHNYLQMHRNNLHLQRILKELTAEMDVDPHYRDIIATEI